MQVYIHTFIATRENYNLAPLQPTEPIHVRLFFSPHHISKDAYQQYMEWTDCADQCTEFHWMGAAPATLTKASLLPPGAFATQVGPIKYDFMLEALDDYHAYLEFVRETLKVEAQRPAFRPQAKLVLEKSPEDSFLGLKVESSATKVLLRDEIPAHPTLPTLLLIHPAYPFVTHPVYALWLEIVRTYVDRAVFYRQEDVTTKEPWILSSMGNGCWMQCSSLADIEKHMNRAQCVMYQLSSGKLVVEKPTTSFLYGWGWAWGELLGTEAMPHVTIRMSLCLRGDRLIKKQGEDVLETRLTEAQREIVRPFFTNMELQPFSLKALFALFATPESSRSVNPFSQAIAALGGMAGSVKALHEDNDMAPGPFTVGTDAFACTWESVPTVKATPHAPLQEEIAGLLREFKESQALLHTPPPITISPTTTLFQHGFLLYLLSKQESERSKGTKEYRPLIDFFQTSGLDLQGVEYTAAHVSILYPLLAPNTEFIDTAPMPEGLTVLEARVLLSIFQYPVEFNTPSKSLLFQIVVKEFAKGVKKGEGRVGAKVLWDTFLAFLRKHRVDYVGFFGSQQDFNDVLRELGWDQKRMAQGKVWMNMELQN